MKFKATVVNDGAGSPKQDIILKVLQALQRLERSAEKRRASGVPPSVVVKLTDEAFAFCHRGGSDEGSQTWSHFQVQRLFQEYRIESKRGNKIDLEAPIANLLHVFHSCASSDRTTLRLANGRDGRPVLGFEFHLAGNATDHKVDQEVPVRVIPEAEAETICEPALPEPDYQLEIPGTVSRIRNVLDRMKQVGASHVTVEAAKEQSAALSSAQPRERAWLKLSAESDLVEIATTFPGLSLVKEGKEKESPDGPVALYLSLKRLAEVLAAVQLLSADSHIACVLEGKALVLYVLLPAGLGSLICYTSVTVS
eukprot:TRINITY_DN105385_c0_g1_i1.p1 TRINITY_DN105385_c0_g1~~TRINITY_DN105385_c0_g1_i1.p1  ORF type:complete len:310 (+),score=72.52 TRINITY_DN105385_c0_g1_i1:137-1066(+)